MVRGVAFDSTEHVLSGVSVGGDIIVNTLDCSQCSVEICISGSKSALQQTNIDLESSDLTFVVVHKVFV